MRKFLLALLLLPALALAQVGAFAPSATFTGTLTGYASPPTTTVTYTYQGPLVVLSIATASGTSNATTLTMTGMPAVIQPATLQACFAQATDNGAETFAPCTVGTDGTITFYKGVYNGAWTGSATKGVRQCTVVYLRY